MWSLDGEYADSMKALHWRTLKFNLKDAGRIEIVRVSNLEVSRFFRFASSLTSKERSFLLALRSNKIGLCDDRLECRRSLKFSTNRIKSVSLFVDVNAAVESKRMLLN